MDRLDLLDATAPPPHGGTLPSLRLPSLVLAAAVAAGGSCPLPEQSSGEESVE